MDKIWDWFWLLVVSGFSWLWHSNFFWIIFWGAFTATCVGWFMKSIVREALNETVVPVLNQISNTLDEISEKLGDDRDNS